MKLTIQSVATATVLALLLITFMTIFGELSVGFKALLVQIGGHHWIGKGIVSLVGFFGTLLIFHNSDRCWNDRKLALSVAIITILLGFAIFGFFVAEFIF